MKERFEVSVFFWTEGFGTAADITKQMGIPPTFAWNKGEPDPRPYLPDYINENSYWELACPAPPGEIIGVQFAALLDVLEPRKDTILELAGKFEVGITCVCYFPDTCPSFSLNTSILRRCGELNLPLNFELFCADDEETFLKFVNRHPHFAVFENTAAILDEEPTF